MSREMEAEHHSTGQSTRSQLEQYERAHTLLPFEAPPRKDFFLVSKITTSDYKRIRVDGKLQLSLSQMHPRSLQTVTGGTWASVTPCDSSLDPEPCSLGHHLQGCCRLSQANQVTCTWGFCPGTMLGRGNQLLGARVIGAAVDLSVATLTPNKLKMIKTKSLDKDGGLMTYVSSGKSHTLNPGLAKYDHLARSEPLPFCISI